MSSNEQTGRRGKRLRRVLIGGKQRRKASAGRAGAVGGGGETHVVRRQERGNLEFRFVLGIYGDLVEVGPRAGGRPEAGPSVG